MRGDVFGRVSVPLLGSIVTEQLFFRTDDESGAPNYLEQASSMEGYPNVPLGAD